MRGSFERKSDAPRATAGAGGGEMAARPSAGGFRGRRKSCPFSGPQAPKIDYKNANMLRRYVSDRGKMTPSRISAVSPPKQRELAIAIKRARYLALLPYCDTRGGGGGGGYDRDRG